MVQWQHPKAIVMTVPMSWLATLKQLSLYVLDVALCAILFGSVNCER